jgi:hypothetical protein
MNLILVSVYKENANIELNFHKCGENLGFFEYSQRTVTFKISRLTYASLGRGSFDGNGNGKKGLELSQPSFLFGGDREKWRGNYVIRVVIIRRNEGFSF